MQVILLKDVPKVGKKGELCNVADGYGRNFLIARGFAVVASAGRLRAVEKENLEHAAQQKREKEAAQAQAVRLEAKPLVIKANSGAQDKLFGSITSADIALAVKEQFNEDVDKKNIKLDEPIRKLGEFKIVVKLHPQVKATLLVKVEKI
ncbi:50S ribosomal protein L9 [bacterium]|nr:50S ribosomal protein L9 [bacterium]